MVLEQGNILLSLSLSLSLSDHSEKASCHAVRILKQLCKEVRAPVNTRRGTEASCQWPQE